MIVSNNTLYYHTWSDFELSLNNIIDDIEREKPDTIVFMALEEYVPDLGEPVIYTERQSAFQKINKLINQYNIDFVFVFGSIKLELHDQLLSQIKCRIVFFPLSWLYNTYDNISNFLDFDKTVNIDKLYISLNHIPKIHRCILMDELCKNNLLDNGYISWLDEKSTLIEDNGFYYHWKYWKPKKMILDQLTGDNLFNQWIIPSEYKKVLVNIIPETSEFHVFLTEKTFMSIFYRQPFLISGGRYTHKLLKDYGFKLYDEVFDYSFDNFSDHMDRIQGIIDNLLKIKNKDYTSLRNMMEETIEYNFNHAIKIIENKEYIPYGVKKILEKLKADNNCEHFVFKSLKYNLKKNII